MSDIENSLDSAQFGNRKGRSMNHYLIKIIHRILSTLDNNSKRETFAVVANLIDWSKAFPRQCPKLGVESFITDFKFINRIESQTNNFLKSSILAHFT